jgi:replicative DNA helicase
MLDLSERSEPVDLITLSETLKARGELAEVGGASYLAELTERVPTAANIAHYAKIVRGALHPPRPHRSGTEIASRGYQASDDVDQLLDRAEQLDLRDPGTQGEAGVLPHRGRAGRVDQDDRAPLRAEAGR